MGSLLISDKIDFKSKTATKDKEGNYIIIKGSIHQKDITIINIYVPNIRPPKYIKQMLTDLNGKINSTTIAGILTAHSQQSIDHPARKSIRKHWT